MIGVVGLFVRRLRWWTRIQWLHRLSWCSKTEVYTRILPHSDQFKFIWLTENSKKKNCANKILGLFVGWSSLQRAIGDVAILCPRVGDRAKWHYSVWNSSPRGKFWKMLSCLFKHQLGDVLRCTSRMTSQFGCCWDKFSLNQVSSFVRITLARKGEHLGHPRVEEPEAVVLLQAFLQALPVEDWFRLGLQVSHCCFCWKSQVLLGTFACLAFACVEKCPR